MPVCSEKHALQECDKIYPETGSKVPEGYWEIHRALRLFKEEGWSNFHTVYLALCIEDLPDVRERVKQTIQRGQWLNSSIVRTESYRSIYWGELTEYFRDRLAEGVL